MSFKWANTDLESVFTNNMKDNNLDEKKEEIANNLKKNKSSNVKNDNNENKTSKINSNKMNIKHITNVKTKTLIQCMQFNNKRMQQYKNYASLFKSENQSKLLQYDTVKDNINKLLKSNPKSIISKPEDLNITKQTSVIYYDYNSFIKNGQKKTELPKYIYNLIQKKKSSMII